MAAHDKAPTKHGYSHLFWAIAGLAALIPLAYGQTTYDIFSLPKAIALWMGAGLISFLISISWLSERRIIWPHGRAAVWLIAFIAVLIASSVMSINPAVGFFGYRKSYMGLTTYLSGPILFYGAWLSVTADRLKVFARVAAGVAGLISVLALFQHFGLRYPYDFASFGTSMSGAAERVGGTIGNPNFLGLYLAMALPLALGLALTENHRLKAVWWLPVPLMLAGLFVTRSMGAWMAAATVLTLGGAERLWPRLDMRAKIAFVASATAGAAVILAILWFKTDLAFSFNERLDIWSMGIAATRQTPVLGGGLDTIGYTMQNFKPYRLQFFTAEAHNLFIYIGASAGLPALAIFMLLINKIITVKKPEEPNEHRTLFAAFKLSLIAYLVGAQFNPDSIATFTLFWIIGGTIAGHGWAPARAKIKSTWPGVLAILAAGAIFLGMAAVSVNLWRAESYAKLATGQRNIYSSWAYATKAQESWPYHSFYALFLFDGSEELIGQDSALARVAMETITKAIVVHPIDPDLYYARGKIHQLLSQKEKRRYNEEKALASYKKSLLFNRFKLPTNYEIGKFYLDHGEKEKARHHFDLLLKQLPVSDERRNEILRLKQRT